MADNMEKYGVEEEPEDNEKTAEQPKCPEPGCDELLEKHGSVRKCPVHGTEPFETPSEK